MKYPEHFTRRIGDTYGPEGVGWLKSLPKILEQASVKWSLTLHEPFEDMAYNYVTQATRSDGMEVVLKVGVPNRELWNEINALRSFNGKGAVNLLEADLDLGAMLLERLIPGEAVLHLEDDEQATQVAIEVMKELQNRSPSSADFPSVADWAEGLKRLRIRFNGGSGPFPSHLVEMAEGLLRDLLPTMDIPMLLHGDLHHWNILSAERAPWLAIDPQGVIGELAYETGAWIRNPFPELLRWSDAKRTLSGRMDQFAKELVLERDRIRGWAIYQAVLAAWWSFEDGDQDWENWLAVAELMI